MLLHVLACAVLIFASMGAHAANFSVTSDSCLGAGSITEAINQANASQGPHTITIQAGLTVDVTLCPSPVPGALPDLDYLFLLKENITIVGDGSGATILGHNQRVTTSGTINPLLVCSAPGDIIVASTPRLFRIGTKWQDNSRAKVTMRNLKVQGVAGIAAVWDRASLSLEDMWLREIFSSKSCELPAIEMHNGADLTLTRNRWEYVVNWSPTLLGFITNGSIAGTNAGNLTITDSQFSFAAQTGLISWGGSQGSQVNIVSSTTLRNGGIWVSSPRQVDLP